MNRNKVIIIGVITAVIIGVAGAFYACQKDSSMQKEEITSVKQQKTKIIWGWYENGVFYMNCGVHQPSASAVTVYKESKYIYPYPDCIARCSKCGIELPSPITLCPVCGYSYTTPKVEFSFGVEGWMETHRRVIELVGASHSERQGLVATYEEDEDDVLKLSSMLPITLINKVISGEYQMKTVTEEISNTGLKFEYNIQFTNVDNETVAEKTVIFRYVLSVEDEE